MYFIFTEGQGNFQMTHQNHENSVGAGENVRVHSGKSPGFKCTCSI